MKEILRTDFSKAKGNIIFETKIPMRENGKVTKKMAKEFILFTRYNKRVFFSFFKGNFLMMNFILE